MKLTLATLLGILLQSQLYGQSPFDYGKNREVYFISTEIRTTLGFDEIYTVYKGDASSQSGKGQNWEITAIAFGGDEISDSWIPVTRDDDFRYNFDSLVNDPRLTENVTIFRRDSLLHMVAKVMEPLTGERSCGYRIRYRSPKYPVPAIAARTTRCGIQKMCTAQQVGCCTRYRTRRRKKTQGFQTRACLWQTRSS